MSMIESLLYLTARRPGISYSVGVYGRYHANPRDRDLKNVKGIIIYVSGTMDYDIWYTNDTCSNLVCFCDADWAGSV